MAISDEELQHAKKMLEQAARPLFLHDDDPDGVCSFVMCYQFTKEGKGVCVKQSPILKEEYKRKVEEYEPDLVVILDKPGVEEGFFENVKQPILWIDHHEPQLEQVARYGNITYVNPRVADDADNRPTSYWIHKMLNSNLWLATVGSIGDWYLPDYLEEFKQEYPELLPETYEKVEDLYLDTPIGLLIKVIQFNLKGTITDVRKSILTLTRIEKPEEILQQTTPRGRFLWKKYKRHADGYDRHVESAKKAAEKEGKILLYEYPDTGQTYTAELSNELLIRYPDRITIVCRTHDEKRKCSIRSKDIEIPTKLQKALEGLEGRGGGHTNACGAVIAEKDWDIFYKRFSEQL